MTVADDAIKVLHGVDASRRVGWARAFAESERSEELSRDLNVMRSERDIMRRALSFMYGFSEVYAARSSGGRTQEALRQMLIGLDAVLDSDIASQGRRLAESCVATEPPQRVTQIEAIKKMNRNTSRSIQRGFYNALARRYGFRDYRRLRDLLDRFLLPVSTAVGDDLAPLSERDEVIEALIKIERTSRPYREHGE